MRERQQTENLFPKETPTSGPEGNSTHARHSWPCSPQTGNLDWLLMALHTIESGHMLRTVSAPGTVILMEASTLGKNAANNFHTPYISNRKPKNGQRKRMRAIPAK
mmetsp:Transcript_73446/g.204001  ORF Transcript_73446/g.204001 Transcript_73446/m.204001 type:complete len:106 (-) Transcript_73446:343-660(-)